MKANETFWESLARRFTHYEGQLRNSEVFTEASVFVPLIETEEGVSLLFEKRSELVRQPGEVSFPGGRIESFDANPAAAAVRETCEELGLPRSDVELYGNMDYFVSHLGLIIYPSVGRIHSLERIRIQEEEVEEIFTVPLEWFLTAEPHIGKVNVATKPEADFPFQLLPETYRRDWRVRKQYEVLFYVYGERVIWGLTAQIVQEFLKKLCRKGEENEWTL